MARDKTAEQIDTLERLADRKWAEHSACYPNAMAEYEALKAGIAALKKQLVIAHG